MRIAVLDQGFVALRSYMQPAPDFDLLDNPEYGGTEADLILESRKGWTGDLEVVRNARVSYDADWRTGEDAGKDEALIRRMTGHNHTSPFEAMVFTFEVKAPIFVLRQWHRHRTQSFNELSARYAELKEGYYVPAADQITGQHETDKQMRGDQVLPNALDIQRVIESECNRGQEAYEALLRRGCARELARTVLSLATYSRMFCTVDLHNLKHFLRLRLDPHAQFEIREYARALQTLATKVCPVSMAEFAKTLGG